MPDRTPIQWTDATWNPVRGCSRVSEGCRHCYAELIAARFSGPGQAYEGLARRRENGEPQWTGKVQLVERHLRDPLKWRAPRRVFVNSMSDLFHEKLSELDIAKVFGVMASAPKHTFQILTKRPDRMRGWFEWIEQNHQGRGIGGTRLAPIDWVDDGDAPLVNWKWPLPNVWLGVSVEDQKAAAERIPLLVLTPAAVRFVSAEPLLEAVNLLPLMRAWRGAYRHTPLIDWVIIGGESGHGARPFDVQWARDIIAQCRVAGVAPFVKQLGKWISGDWPINEHGHVSPAANRWLFPGGRVWVPGIVGDHNWRRPDGAIALGLRDGHGGNWNEWPEDLRVREFPDAAVPA